MNIFEYYFGNFDELVLGVILGFIITTPITLIIILFQLTQIINLLKH